MNNSHQFDPFYSVKNPKLMTKEELRQHKKNVKRIKRESFGSTLHYLNYRKGAFAAVVILNLLSAIFMTTSTFLIGYLTDVALGYDQLRIGGDFKVWKFVIGFTMMGVSYLLGSGLSMWSDIVSNKVGVIAGRVMRSEAYQKLMKMPISFFDATNTGEVMSILSNDIDNITFGFADALSPLLMSVFIIVASFGFMLYNSVYLSLIVLVLIPLFLSIVVILMLKAIPQFEKQQSRTAKLNGYIEEHLAAIHLIRNFNQAKIVNKTFEKYNDKLYGSSFKASLYSGIIWPYSLVATFIIQIIIGVIAVVFSTNNISTGSGQMFSVGVITNFILYTRNISDRVNRIFQNLTTLQIGIVSSARVLQLIKLTPLVDETKLENIGNVKGDVEFKNVYFSYSNNLENLQLKNASFKAKRGQIFAIVGPTGAGKTTIINLLSKFYLPLSGEIRIDGHLSSNVNEHSWRNQISIVLQDTFLFKTTIMNNLKYANPNATDEEVIAAAKISNAHEFIMQLENQYSEVVLEGGVNFSQGERQLLAITRAIIANKNILILDEATSNVDTRTEKHIQNAMLSLMKGKTSFVIAHRLSTIVNADKILVVQNGEIIEQGNHTELLAKKGFYEQLYNSSFDDGE